jgi:large subunit ribosomal protein L33
MTPGELAENRPGRQNRVFVENCVNRETAMAKKSKDARDYVKMQSSESSHCYYVEKNRHNTKDRLQLRKYDPIVRKHVLYKEGKM